MGPPIAMSAGSPGGSPSVSDEHGLVPVEISGVRVTAEDLGLRIRLTRCTQRRGGIQVELSIFSAADRRVGPSGPPEQPTRLYQSGRLHTVDNIFMDGALIRSERTAVPVRAGKPSELELEFEEMSIGDDEVDALDLWIIVDGVPRGFRFEAITIE